MDVRRRAVAVPVKGVGYLVGGFETITVYDEDRRLRRDEVRPIVDCVLDSLSL